MTDTIVEQARVFFDALVKSRFIEMNRKSLQVDRLGNYIQPYSAKRAKCEKYPILSITKEHGIVLQEDKFKKRIASSDTTDYKIVPRGILVQGIHIDERNFGIQDIVDAGIVSPAYKLWTINIEKSNSEYIAYAMRSDDFAKYLQSKFRGSIRRRENVTTEDILNAPLNIPPLDIQNAFISFVKQVDKAKITFEREVARYDELIKSRFIEMFDNLEMCPLSEYVDSFSGGKSLAGSEECVNKVLNTGSVTFGYFNPNDVKNLPTDYVPNPKHLVRKGDLLVSRMNTPALVGAVAYVNVDVKNTYMPDRLWKAHYKSNCNPIYLWQSLLSEKAKRQITSAATGTSGTMKNITKEKMFTIKIPKAPLELQNQFAQFYEQVDKSKVMLLESLKKIVPDY